MGIYNTKGAYPIVESPLCLMLVCEVYATSMRLVSFSAFAVRGSVM